MSMTALPLISVVPGFYALCFISTNAVFFLGNVLIFCVFFMTGDIVRE